MNIQIQSKASFINPWTKKPLIAGETVTVPFDNLCRSLLRDGSFTRVEKGGVRSVECGVRSAECGVKSAECGVKSAECGVKSGERDEGSAEKKTGKKEQREEKIIKNEKNKKLTSEVKNGITDVI